MHEAETLRDEVEAANLTGFFDLGGFMNQTLDEARFLVDNLGLEAALAREAQVRIDHAYWTWVLEGRTAGIEETGQQLNGFLASTLNPWAVKAHERNLAYMHEHRDQWTDDAAGYYVAMAKAIMTLEDHHGREICLSPGDASQVP